MHRRKSRDGTESETSKDFPDLPDEQARDLRRRPVRRCKQCCAQIWANYCRQHAYFFEDGHWPNCKRWSVHSEHRKY